MGIDCLESGRGQAFYLTKFMMPPLFILVRDLITSYLSIFDVSFDDKSTRYVAVGNIAIIEDYPSEPMLSLAGRYSKRWDNKDKKFIGKPIEKYPDDQVRCQDSQRTGMNFATKVWSAPLNSAFKAQK